MVRLILTATLVCAMAASAQAWSLFGGKQDSKKEKTTDERVEVSSAAGGGTISMQQGDAAPARVVARAHIRLDSDAREQEFLNITAARRRAQEDFLVISRLMQEKQLEIRKFRNELNERFEIDPDGNYEFNEEEGVIYVLTPRGDDVDISGVTGREDLDEMFERKVHRTLEEKDREAFLRLVASRQLASEQVEVLSLLRNEKEIELTTVQQLMVDKYAISNDREYRYDQDTRTLFELVRVPASFDGGSDSPDTDDVITK